MTIIVSYSEVSKFQTCRRQWYYRFFLNLSPVEENATIATGVKGHKLLQNFYEFLREGKTKEKAQKLTTDSAKNLLNREGMADYSLLSAWTLVDNYIRETDFTSEFEIIENRFLFPATILDDDPNLTDVQIGFTPDLVRKRKGDFLDVEDSKFVQRAWSKSKINRYQQSKLYQIFLEHMGYEISRSIIRFFNVQTAKITEQPYTLTDAERVSITYDFMEGVKELVRFKREFSESSIKPPRTMNYTNCQFCHFEFPCTLEAEGKDASKTLKNLYVKSTYDYTR